MGLPINIQELFSGRSVEWERLEFKRGWNPQEVLHTVCAFANDFHNMGGGYVVIGVAEENGRPLLPAVGIPADQLDSVQKELLNLGFNAVQPPLSSGRCTIRSERTMDIGHLGTRWSEQAIQGEGELGSGDQGLRPLHTAELQHHQGHR